HRSPRRLPRRAAASLAAWSKPNRTAEIAPEVSIAAAATAPVVCKVAKNSAMVGHLHVVSAGEGAKLGAVVVVALAVTSGAQPPARLLGQSRWPLRHLVAAHVPAQNVAVLGEA